MSVVSVPVALPEVVRSHDRPVLQLAPLEGSFVGREREVASVVAALSAGQPRVWISGASGLGKTALLAQLAARYRSLALPYHWLGPYEPATPTVLRAIVDELVRAAGPRGRRRVLVIDDFAQLRPIERWFVDRFLPTLPEAITVVVADRAAAPIWRAGAGVALAPLGEPDARRYLALRGVPDELRADIVGFAEGIPALLAAEADAVHPPPRAARAYIDQRATFYTRHASDDQRLAIAVLASARTTPYEQLELAFDDALAARDAFAWLSRLSVVDHTPHGLRPHAVLRKAWERDLADHARASWARARRVIGAPEVALGAAAVPALVTDATAVARPAPIGAIPRPAAGEASELSVVLARRIAELAASAALSPREREVLQLLLLGRNYTDIGTALAITPRTARFHQHNVLEKIGAESRLDIVRLLL